MILQLSQNPKHINKQKQNHNYRGQTGGLQRVEEQESWEKYGRRSGGLGKIGKEN